MDLGHDHLRGQDQLGFNVSDLPDDERPSFSGSQLKENAVLELALVSFCTVSFLQWCLLMYCNRLPS